ncbi:LemA family protein [Candidatus Micrarchaeota archaeon]|nr:LemA family protein [Candidatus Micrarchaeota archaeon]MBU1165980.1 LemA family protein [Candidatus Micrarchaeota archaeon]
MLDILATGLLCVVGIVVLGLLVYAVMVYNRLVTLRNRVENAWAQIDVQLKRRYDLIPNLMETVKGYMKHEKTTLENVTKYRAQLVTGSVEERAQANNMLSQSLKSLFAVSENYPKLQASENFKMLQEELAGTENKISYIRTAYNDTVLSYDNVLEQFPTNIVANTFGFKSAQYFKIDEVEKVAPKVKFD